MTEASENDRLHTNSQVGRSARRRRWQVVPIKLASAFVTGVFSIFFVLQVLFIFHLDQSVNKLWNEMQAELSLRNFSDFIMHPPAVSLTATALEK